MKPFYRITLALTLSLLGPGALWADTFTVDPADPGFDANCADFVCDLQAALTEAEGNAEADTINIVAGTFDATPTSDATDTFNYTAAGGENFSLTINGVAGSTILDADSVAQILNIDTTGAGGDDSADIFINGVIFQNGSTGGAGGGLDVQTNDASIVVQDCQFLDNAAAGGDGGGARLEANSGGSTSILNSTFSGNSATGEGGAVEADGQSITVTGSTFENNSAGADGGAADFCCGPIVTLEGNTFTDNISAGDGGAIVSDGSTTTLTGNAFTGNEAGGSNVGGAVDLFSNSDPMVLTDNNFENNSSGDNGGAALLDTNGGPLALTGNTFTGNSSGNDGGGLNTEGSGVLTLTANTFSNNSAGNNAGGADLDGDHLTLDGNLFADNDAVAEGGGLDAEILGTSMVLTNNVFVNNNTIGDGGGALLDTSDDGSDQHIVLTNNTFTRNIANDDAGGLLIRLADDADSADLGDIANIFNNIIFGNTATLQGDDLIIDDDAGGSSDIGTVVNLYNNDFAELITLCQADCNPEVNQGDNINADPLFADAAGGDVHIASSSQAVNAGTLSAPFLPDTDFDGEDRLGGGIPDMGADETSVGGPVDDADDDDDGVLDVDDNCPTVSNADQADADSDGTGDACEVADGDGGGCSLVPKGGSR